jgi:hypothetical protein
MRAAQKKARLECLKSSLTSVLRASIFPLGSFHPTFLSLWFPFALGPCQLAAIRQWRSKTAPTITINHWRHRKAHSFYQSWVAYLVKFAPSPPHPCVCGEPKESRLASRKSQAAMPRRRIERREIEMRGPRALGRRKPEHPRGLRLPFPRPARHRVSYLERRECAAPRHAPCWPRV